jgi:hypothetical protein
MLTRSGIRRATTSPWLGSWITCTSGTMALRRNIWPNCSQHQPPSLLNSMAPCGAQYSPYKWPNIGSVVWQGPRTTTCDKTTTCDAKPPLIVLGLTNAAARQHRNAAAGGFCASGVKGNQAIADVLDAHGIRTGRGGTWERTTVRKLLARG